MAISTMLHGVLLILPGSSPSRESAGYKIYALREALRARIALEGSWHREISEPPPTVPSSVSEQPVPAAPVPLMEMGEPHELIKKMPPYLSMDQVDRRPELIGEIELESEQRPDTAGFVINFRIEVSANGRADHVVVTSNWLDSATTEKLLQQLKSARYRPALKMGRPVAAVLEGGLGLSPDEKGPADAGPGSSVSPQR